MNTVVMIIGYAAMIGGGLFIAGWLLMAGIDKVISLLGVKHELFCYMWDRKKYRQWKAEQEQIRITLQGRNIHHGPHFGDETAFQRAHRHQRQTQKEL